MLATQHSNGYASPHPRDRTEPACWASLEALDRDEARLLKRKVVSHLGIAHLWTNRAFPLRS